MPVSARLGAKERKMYSIGGAALMAGNRPDRRVQRTHRALHEALASLIVESGWDAVSVQDICNKADIGRSTFYKHFSGKEALLADALDTSRKDIRARQSVDPSRKDELLPFACGMLEHIYERQQVFRAIGKRSGYVVQRYLRDLVVRMANEDLATLAPSGWQRDAVVHYVAGAFVELLVWWIDGRHQQKPAEIDRLFDTLTRSAIKQLRDA